MVKSIIGEVMSYYPSPAYQLKTDGVGTNTRKYYHFGGNNIALRENGVLTWLLNDHLNSTALTANEDGSLASEIRYTALGEVRYANGVTVTDNKYTGQREEMELGLYYYVARWYDPYRYPNTIGSGAGYSGDPRPNKKRLACTSLFLWRGGRAWR